MTEITSLFALDFKSVVLGVFTVLIASKVVITLFDWFVDRLGIETRATREKNERIKVLNDTSKEITDIKKTLTNEVEVSTTTYNNIIATQQQIIEAINSIKTEDVKRDEKIDDMSQRMEGMKKASIEIMYDRLYQRCRYFYSQGFIPIAEVDSLRTMLESYTAIHGNHGAQDMVEKTIKELPAK